MLEMQLKGYFHNDEEVRLKTIIWTEMNKEYLEVIYEQSFYSIFSSKGILEALLVVSSCNMGLAHSPS